MTPISGLAGNKNTASGTTKPTTSSVSQQANITLPHKVLTIAQSELEKPSEERLSKNISTLALMLDSVSKESTLK